MESKQRNPRQEAQRHLIEAVITYVAFCGLSGLSRFVPPLFLLVVVSGIAFPLVWATLTRSWSSIGVTRRNLRQALLWGLGAGMVYTLYIYISLPEEPSFSAMLILQSAVGIPLWLLIVSPFQELFFRGWIQPRFQEAMGKWIGLAVTSFCFALWHLFPPFQGTPTSTIPVSSVGGFLSTMALGVLMGYVFQRTDNIVAPWLAHALAGISAVVFGMMSFIQHTP